MTDKIKKLEALTDDVQPEFPTLNRGGYVEDTVDEWLTNHLKEVNEIINYQNYGVDVVDGLEAELAQAHARIAELEAHPVFVDPAFSTEEDTLREELASAHARIAELENTSMIAFPTADSDIVKASILLQHATKLGADYIEKAKADGEQLRADAEARLVEVREEVQKLEAHRYATFLSLSGFFTQELAKLQENPVFLVEEEEVPDSEEDAVEDEVVESDEAPESEEGAEGEAVDSEEDAVEDEAVESDEASEFEEGAEDEVVESDEAPEFEEEDVTADEADAAFFVPLSEDVDSELEDEDVSVEGVEFFAPVDEDEENSDLQPLNEEDEDEIAEKDEDLEGK